MNVQDWQTLSQAYAFLGNSLLKPMAQTSPVGLDPAFWRAFPSFESEEVEQALQACAAYAEALADEMAAEDGAWPTEEAVRRVGVEYTHLFVGPPTPAAAPWETFYRSENVTVGFGEATFQMRAALREAGLELSNENRQYEDHMGIELLLLSELCRAAADASDEPADGKVAAFMDTHPRGWAGALRQRIAEEEPNGYFQAIVGLAQAVLDWHRGELRP